MISQITEPYNEKEISGVLDPIIREWFFSKFKAFSMPQMYGVMPIHERKNILITAPTGGTKTLTSFLSILNYLVKLARRVDLEDKVYAIYVSPLKALNYDIEVNLQEPLKEIQKVAKKFGVKLQDIRVAARTGDTSSAEKTAQLKKPPHILITTPETLAIVLTTKKFVDTMKAVEFVIIDEIHALASGKRGIDLSLSLERLEHVSVIAPVRIGLSATIAPLDEIAKFLVGYEYKDGKYTERDCLIANVQFLKKMDFKVLSPVDDLIDTTASQMHLGLYGLLDNLIQEHKTTLIFTNTRSATERVVNHLKEKFPKKYTSGEIGAHHSSLSKKHRRDIEKKLRNGELKAVVCSTSLELGIDIGYIDLVLQLGSPKSVARALQRQGRSGHKLHDVTKGRLIVLDRDDLIECSVLLKEGVEKKIDRIQIPKNAFDVLSQHIYGMAISHKWNIDELFSVIKKSYCYHDLSKEDFYEILSYLSGEYAELESKNVYAKIWIDWKTKELGKRGKLARMIYMTNIGTIPEESFVNVVIAVPADRREEKIGVIDESFLERIEKGDVFVLGGSKYEFLYSKGMNVYVNASVSRQPTIPSWASEMLPLSFDLAMQIQRFRKLMDEKFSSKQKENEIKIFIREFLYVDEKAVNAIYNFFREQYLFSKIPHEKRLLIEYFEDEDEKKYALFHTLYGRRVNDALSRAIAFAVARYGNRDIELGISDNGFYLASHNKMNIDKALREINSKNLREILEQAIGKTEVFKRRFRHCAARSLMILRSYMGRRRSVGKQQMKSVFLLGAVKRLNDNFPILKETRREVLEDLMDIENAKYILDEISKNKIKIEKMNTEVPSPFAFNLITQAHADLLRIEDKIEFLKRMHKEVLKRIKS
ncbi:MAG: ATP-dependent helicase [Nanoarchaeota archaeon]|nr:ATP-dependent helicase [Nanoarchaeota archaeon]